MPITAPTAGPAPQLACATRIVPRNDGSIQAGIMPTTAVRAALLSPEQQSLFDIASGRRTDNPRLVDQLQQQRLLEGKHRANRILLRMIGSLANSESTILNNSGLVHDPRARLALVLSIGEPARSAVDPLVRLDIPHLIVRALDGRVIIGPFVIPSITACLRCLDAHHGDDDPDYSALLERYIAAGALPREDGCIDIPDPADAAFAIAWAARDLSLFASGGDPATLSSTITLAPNDGSLTAVTWRTHPGCGCRWYEIAH